MSPWASADITSLKLNFDTTNYSPIAKAYTDASFKIEVDQLNENYALSEEEKLKIVYNISNDSILDLSSQINVDLGKYLNETQISIFKKLMYNALFPLSAEASNIDYKQLIALLSDLNKKEDYFYVDSFSIFKLARLFSFKKFYYIILKENISSDFKRKKLFKWWKEANEIIQSKWTGKNNKTDYEMLFFIDIMKKLFVKEGEPLISDISFSSETQSLKMILKRIPERIISHKEVINNKTIKFNRSKVKDELLYQILQYLYPDKNKDYLLIFNYPDDLNTEHDKYIRSTVTQKFY